MTIKNRLVVIAAFLITMLIIASSAQQIASDKNSLQADDSKTRYLSYLIADEFRQSSLDLTRLCRTYVATGDNRRQPLLGRILEHRQVAQR